MINPDFLEMIHQYLEKQITISELEEWLVPREPFLLREPESDDSDIIGVIELGLVDMSAGSIAEDEFRNQLRQEVRSKTETVWAEYPETDFRIVTGSSYTFGEISVSLSDRAVAEFNQV